MRGFTWLARMLAAVMRVRIGNAFMVLRAVIHHTRAGLLGDLCAGQTACRKRVQRKHGQQEPNQECLECAGHRCAEYSTTVFGLDRP